VSQIDTVSPLGDEVLDVHFDLIGLWAQLQSGEVISTFPECLLLIGDALGLQNLDQSGLLIVSGPVVLPLCVGPSQGLIGIELIQIAVKGVALNPVHHVVVPIVEYEDFILLPCRLVDPVNTQSVRGLCEGLGELEVPTVPRGYHLDRSEIIVHDH
jgi:hypothetical protein